MLIVIEFFVKDQSELDSPELDSPRGLVMAADLTNSHRVAIGVLEKVWNMLSVQHCMPLAF